LSFGGCAAPAAGIFRHGNRHRRLEDDDVGDPLMDPNQRRQTTMAAGAAAAARKENANCPPVALAIKIASNFPACFVVVDSM
jgi:hypothetical protein